MILIHKKQMLGVVINWEPTFDTFSQKADVGGVVINWKPTFDTYSQKADVGGGY